MQILLTGSSTTPVINPDAVMDHDDPLKQGLKVKFIIAITIGKTFFSLVQHVFFLKNICCM